MAYQTFRIMWPVGTVQTEIIRHRTETRECRAVLGEMVAKLDAAGWPAYGWSPSLLDVFEEGEWQPYI